MRLSDHLMEARGSLCDLHGIVSSVCAEIERAERFVLSDHASDAAGNIVQSRPSTLLKALPLCRLPYKTMWIEWKGGRVGAPQSRPGAPPPAKMGCLIEGIDDQIGTMTWAWVHFDLPGMPGAGVNVCPFGQVFDWRPEGDIPALLNGFADEWLAQHHQSTMLDLIIEAGKGRWLKELGDETLKWVMTSSRPGWDKFANRPGEIEALRTLTKRSARWVSRHAWNFFALAGPALMSDRHIVRILTGWEADTVGEGPFIEAVLALMNSRNAVESVPVDLTRLNRKRVRLGRAPFLSHYVTDLSLSMSEARRGLAHGLNREQARGHKVRGHFKIRRTGVYWWHDFERGDRSRPMPERESYEVAE
jgi:hypothetical protein